MPHKPHRHGVDMTGAPRTGSRTALSGCPVRGHPKGTTCSCDRPQAQQYGLARSTVRRAIAVLVEEGLVFTVPQRGTFRK
ncbi:GntR family transcriptional regulator [Nocardiopsis quinghaiensis]|uniref:GntR family transcriptional regulator n=1 Tax=Nocardiopsis quinghaiensis TaxID=464995 RepID=UPI001238E55C|nr:GntR family transcriptional regulator [Nocardiopsis quinghaiensis]